VSKNVFKRKETRTGDEETNDYQLSTALLSEKYRDYKNKRKEINKQKQHGDKNPMSLGSTCLVLYIIARHTCILHVHVGQTARGCRHQIQFCVCT
jgi:hypothetical protein